MTEFTIDCPHGHQTKSGLPRKIVAVLDEPLSTGETIIVVGPDAFGDTGVYYYFNDGRYCENRDSEAGSDLINAPAPKRTFKRWYVLVEWDSGGFTDVSFTDKHDAEQYSVASGKIIARYECEIPEGTGLDDSNMQNMHSAPEPEEPKTVHLDFWVNVYGESFSELNFHPTHDDAVMCQKKDGSLLRRIHIERDVTVGEGLDD